VRGKGGFSSVTSIVLTPALHVGDRHALPRSHFLQVLDLGGDPSQGFIQVLTQLRSCPHSLTTADCQLHPALGWREAAVLLQRNYNLLALVVFINLRDSAERLRIL